MSVKIIDHVKRENVRLKTKSTTSGRFIQLNEDNSVVSGVKRRDNEATFTELMADALDMADGETSLDPLVAFQSDGNQFLMVKKPRSRREVTLKIKMVKTKYSEIFDEPRSKIPGKKKAFWFKLKTAEGYHVYESLAYPGFYISVEGEKVHMRKVPKGPPSARNFLIDIMPALKRRFSSRILSRAVSLTAAMIIPSPEPLNGVIAPGGEGIEDVAMETSVVYESEVTEEGSGIVASPCDVSQSAISARIVDIENKSTGVTETSEIVETEVSPEVRTEDETVNTESVVKPHEPSEDSPEALKPDKEDLKMTSEAPVVMTTSAEDNCLIETPDEGPKGHDEKNENTVLEEDTGKDLGREIIPEVGKTRTVRKSLTRFFSLISCVSSRSGE